MSDQSVELAQLRIGIFTAHSECFRAKDELKRAEEHVTFTNDQFHKAVDKLSDAVEASARKATCAEMAAKLLGRALNDPTQVTKDDWIEKAREALALLSPGSSR